MMVARRSRRRCAACCSCPAGIGILIGAAIGGVIAAFPLIKSAVASRCRKRRARSRTPRCDATSDEMLDQGALCRHRARRSSASPPSPTCRDAGAGYLVRAGRRWPLLGTLWIWIAGVIVSECLGRTNWSPLSGMTLIAVTILIFIASGIPSTKATIIVFGGGRRGDLCGDRASRRHDARSEERPTSPARVPKEAADRAVRGDVARDRSSS